MNKTGRIEKKALKENSCQFQRVSAMKSKKIGMAPTWMQNTILV